MDCIAYRGGYKYQLKKTYGVEIEIRPDTSIFSEFIILYASGVLEIKSGYAWDGPSGPTPDLPSLMRGSLVHDALYQLIRERRLALNPHREIADRILRRICVEDGMFGALAWAVYHAVRVFGNPAADPGLKRPIKKAPKGCEAESDSTRVSAA